jgi:hypothetical protein
LSGVSSLLSNEYHEALLGAKLFFCGVGVQKTGTDFAAALNNMDVSSEYVLKLKHEIEEQCAEVGGIFFFSTFHSSYTYLKMKSVEVENMVLLMISL